MVMPCVRKNAGHYFFWVVFCREVHDRDMDMQGLHVKNLCRP